MSYSRILINRVNHLFVVAIGVEPIQPVYETGVLPLDDACKVISVTDHGAGGGIRTRDNLHGKQILYL